VTLDREKGALRVEVFVKGSLQGVDWHRVGKGPRSELQLEPLHSGEEVYQIEIRYHLPPPPSAAVGHNVPVFRLAARLMFGSAAAHIRTYHPLSAPRLPASVLPADPVLLQLRGLWNGIYGPHGEELLHVRFVRTQQEEQEEEAGMEAEAAHGDGGGGGGGLVVCEGLKLTGDPNVPAGKWSFRVDLQRPRDLQAALAADARPIYAALAGDGAVDHVLLDLAEEVGAGRIHGLYPGRGQINRVPGRWRPESVEVDLVVFREQKGETGQQEEQQQWSVPHFGIIWRDDDHPWRHAIKFQRWGWMANTDEALMYCG
jgi:hypothetical protein